MSIPEKYKRRYAYHFTSICNLDSVLDNGLLSTNLKISRNITHFDVAEAGIQDRRSSMAVPGAQGRHVHDYVPFYFAQKTPMQLAVLNKKNVDQQFIIYFALSLEVIGTKPGVFFTSASANTDIPPDFYSAAQSDCLDKLNWVAIDSSKWSYPDYTERHQKMAELLVPDSVSMTEIGYIVAWNESFAEYVRASFAKKGIPCPRVEVNSWHYYSDPTDRQRSIITGPYFLKRDCDETVDKIVQQLSPRPKFPDIASALRAVRANFHSIKELADIDNLRADYGPHQDDVGTHSKRVADLVQQAPEYLLLNSEDKLILEMAAYLHDIGKGPKSRWENSFMDKADNNHACKSLPMLQRIFTEDIGNLSRDAIRKIVMLVTYDDLLGEIAAKGRDKKQFFDIITCESDVNMLAALSRADIGSINQTWLNSTSAIIEQIKVEGLAFLRERANA